MRKGEGSFEIFDVIPENTPRSLGDIYSGIVHRIDDNLRDARGTTICRKWVFVNRGANV